MTRLPTRRGEVDVVRDVTLQIRHREVLGLVGETGSGKSMTAASIVGLVPSGGRVVRGRIGFRERDLATMPEGELSLLRGGAIAFVPQNARSGLNPLLTVRAQMGNVWKAHLELNARGRYEHTLNMLRAVGFLDPARVAASYPHQLSGGMAQRVVVAIAIGTSPDLVIADEPTTGLDATVQLEVLNLFTALIRESEAGCLLITHDLGVVRHYCDRVAVMYAGQIVEEASVQDFFAQPCHPYGAALLVSMASGIGASAFQEMTAAPDLLDLPSGCAYRSRCPLAQQVCADVPPTLASKDQGHLARCHFADRVPKLTDGPLA